VLTLKWTADRPHALRVACLKDGDQRIRVTRENSVDLAGGVAGSDLSARRYRVDNRFTLKR